jgi:hypothetical protein
MESLILAQNERWRRVLSMQVEREPGTHRWLRPGWKGIIPEGWAAGTGECSGTVANG